MVSWGSSLTNFQTAQPVSQKHRKHFHQKLPISLEVKVVHLPCSTEMESCHVWQGPIRFGPSKSVVKRRKIVLALLLPKGLSFCVLVHHFILPVSACKILQTSDGSPHIAKRTPLCLPQLFAALAESVNLCTIHHNSLRLPCVCSVDRHTFLGFLKKEG